MCTPLSALFGQTQKQSVAAAGEVSACWGGQPPAQRIRVRFLHHRPGGDGGGVDSLAVGGPAATLSVGATGHGRGQSALLVEASLTLNTRWSTFSVCF